MKFKEIEREMEQEEIPIMSIGQQLEIMSKVKEIEYQNSLVMKSLEIYNSKYETLKKEHNEQLEKANQKIEQLENSNQILIRELNQLLQKTQGKLWKEFERLQGNIDSLLNEKLASVSRESKEYILNLNQLKSDAKKRHEGFYNRKKWIDQLIMVNLAITPILLFILSYLTFFKK